MCKNLVVIDFMPGDPSRDLALCLLESELDAFYRDEPYRLISRIQNETDINIHDAGKELVRRAFELVHAEQAEHCVHVSPVAFVDPTEGESGVIFITTVTATRPISAFIVSDPPESIPKRIKMQLDAVASGIRKFFSTLSTSKKERERSEGLNGAILNAYYLLSQYLCTRQ